MTTFSHTPVSAGATLGGQPVTRDVRLPQNASNCVYNAAAAATTVEVTSGPAELLGLHAVNQGTADVFVVIFNRPANECSSASPFKACFLVPGTAGNASPVTVMLPVGLQCPNGLCYRVSGSPSSLASMPGGTSSIALNLFYR
jgi:hypothetical protein